MGPIKKDKKSKVLKADDFVPSVESSDKNSMVSGRSIGHKSPVKRVLLLTLLISAIVIIIGLILMTVSSQLNTQDKNQKQAIKVCSDDILQQAGNYIRTNDTIALSRLVEKIEMNPKYIEDSNCLYVTTSYYLKIVDLPKANKNYDNLKSSYDPEIGFSDQLDPFANDIDFFDKEIKRIEAVTEEYKRNSFFGPKVED